MSNKVANELLFQCIASELLDSHALRNDKLDSPAMERSTRSGLDVNSVEVSVLFCWIV